MGVGPVVGSSGETIAADPVEWLPRFVTNKMYTGSPESMSYVTLTSLSEDDNLERMLDCLGLPGCPAACTGQANPQHFSSGGFSHTSEQGARIRPMALNATRPTMRRNASLVPYCDTELVSTRTLCTSGF